MKILDKKEAARQCFSHGGCHVLRVHADRPTGESPAARHLGEIVDALLDFSKRVLLPPAASALTNAVALGQGYRFTPHLVRIALREAPLAGGICVTLSFSLTAEDAMLWSRQLTTYWNEAGTVQFPAPPRKKRRKTLHKRDQSRNKPTTSPFYS